MASEAPQTSTPEEKPRKTLEFQTPPAIAPKISSEEQGAIHGPALTYAKNLSNTAAILAGTIGAGLGSFALIAANAPQRTLKVLASAVAGGVGGYTISNLPWNEKQVPIEMPETSVAHPTIPTIPSTPPAHPAAGMPEASVAAPQHAGRVDTAAVTAERTA